MNKNTLKKFAAQARHDFLQAISQKAYELGIVENEIVEPEYCIDGIMIHQKLYSIVEKQQRDELVKRINRKGYWSVMEEVAYTWFNRFMALRFMEVNNYLPTDVRVLSSEIADKREPDIIFKATELIDELNLDEEIIYDLQDQNDWEQLYKYLLIKQCNALHPICPVMFEKINDYTELLLPNHLLQEQSVIRYLITEIPEQDWTEGVEIIGWLYQYYNSDKKDEVFTKLKKNEKITKENIPAATQLFTPKWIVQYMVENSLGLLWIESNNDASLKENWPYYVEAAPQDIRIEDQIAAIKKPRCPKDITIFDPCMGSGHILVYAFDLLYEMYVSAGYSSRVIPKLILENNLFGLDIDERAAQLASFALIMKARSYSHRFFSEAINMNVFAIQESNGISEESIRYFFEGIDDHRQRQVTELIQTFQHGKIYGSIVSVNESIDFQEIEKDLEHFQAVREFDFISAQSVSSFVQMMKQIIAQGKLLTKKYDIVITNPPYMGRKGMNEELTTYIDQHFPISKFDLFSVFIERGFSFLKEYGFNAFVTMQSWMFLSAYEKLRTELLNKVAIVQLLHMDNMVMGIAFGTSAAVMRNAPWTNYRGSYQYITQKDIEDDRPRQFPMPNRKNSTVTQHEYFKIPSYPIAYWISSQIRNAFHHSLVFDYSISEGQNVTGNNDKFVRFFWEVSKHTIGTDRKWAFYAKGGSYRKWYGNIEHIINWSDEARNYYKKNKISRIIPQYLWFRKGITWGLITSGNKSFRVLPSNATFDKAGSSIFIEGDHYYYYILGLLNSKVAQVIFHLLNPTVSLQVKDVRTIPVIVSDTHFAKITKLVEENIQLCKQNWDTYETSADFQTHPLLLTNSSHSMEQAVAACLQRNNEQFTQLKDNETKLNRLFIKIYGLETELSSQVHDEEVSIQRETEEGLVKSFLHYAIGCMFGRYHLEGVAVPIAAHNIISITHEEYFDNDIVTKLYEFVINCFGASEVDTNMLYIARTLNRNSTASPREVIRKYFVKDFYEEHVKKYKKRPIYWQFDSGKHKGFQGLFYIHRYEVDLMAHLRTEYLHPLQRKYESEMERLLTLIDCDISNREIQEAKNRRVVLQNRLLECTCYDQLLEHIANKKIELQLDDGVKANYNKFQDVEIPISEGKHAVMNTLTAIKL